MITPLQIKNYINYHPTLKELGIDDTTRVTFLAQGEYNQNFLLETIEKNYVFRVNLQSQLQLDKQITYEYEALKFLQTSSVTPSVYYVDDSKTFFPYGVLIMEFLIGRPLNYQTDLVSAASIFATIHSLDIEKSTSFIVEKNLFTNRIQEGEFWLEKAIHSPHLSKDVLKILEKLVAYTNLHEKDQSYFLENSWMCVNNTEVNSHNFIIGEKNSYLIDWEKPVISDPAQDITQFLAPTTTLWRTNYLLSNVEKELFFSSYERFLQVEKSDIRLRVHMYEPYLLLRALTWCASAFVEYIENSKAIKNEETFKKLIQFLDLNFLNELLKDYI